jgi:hypothetical protein
VSGELPAVGMDGLTGAFAPGLAAGVFADSAGRIQLQAKHSSNAGDKTIVIRIDLGVFTGESIIGPYDESPSAAGGLTDNRSFSPIGPEHPGPDSKPHVAFDSQISV